MLDDIWGNCCAETRIRETRSAPLCLFKEHQDVISHFKLIEKKHLIDYLDDIELIFIELPKFTKAESELSNTRDKWLYFIKNAGTLDFLI